MTRRTRDSLSFRIAMWAHANGHERVRRAICLWWGLRNGIRDSDLVVYLETQWFKLRTMFKPRCKVCGVILFRGAFSACINCELNRELRLIRLRPQRPRVIQGGKK